MEADRSTDGVDDVSAGDWPPPADEDETMRDAPGAERNAAAATVCEPCAVTKACAIAGSQASDPHRCKCVVCFADGALHVKECGQTPWASG